VLLDLDPAELTRHGPGPAPGLWPARSCAWPARVRGQVFTEGGGEDPSNQVNPNALHCYVCKQRGHTKKDCPVSRCFVCWGVGHKKDDCPQWIQQVSRSVEQAVSGVRRVDGGRAGGRAGGRSRPVGRSVGRSVGWQIGCW
jgi:hypothetical protein